MAKAYWISCYRKIEDVEKLMAYAKLAGPAIESGGGKFLARGVADLVYEQGIKERVTLIAFDSIEAAVKTHDSAAYQSALAALGDAVERDMRIISAVD